jgi:hypothetical protein
MATVFKASSKLEPSLWRDRLTSPLAIALYFALADLLIHVLTNWRYGYFRDELYFIACGEHLDWGYADHAPMIALITKASRVLLGDSLSALRFFPAVAGAITVFLTGLLADLFGGRRFAVALACLGVLVAPAILATHTILSMNAFEPIFWMGSIYFIALAIKRNDPRFLIGFGLLAGLGLENKHSMLFFGFALTVSLLLTPARKFFASKWLWIAGALAFLLFLPNIIWEQQHNWATLELLNNVKQSGKNVALSPWDFIVQQFLLLNPFTAPLWIAGLLYFLLDREGRHYRFIGIAYLVALVLMIALSGKNYYLLAAYPALFAGGGVLWGRLVTSWPQLGWLKVAFPVLLVVAGLFSAPFGIPVLPVESFIRYEHALGFEPPKTEVSHAGPLPQLYGDMFGWPELVKTVADIYYRLPPEERSKTAIYANNYGEAGAIDFFGSRYGLPKAISPHQNYWFWGPREYTGEVMILLQSSRKDVAEHCSSFEEAAEIYHPYGMEEENRPVFICRGLKQPLKELWPKLKHWN